MGTYCHHAAASTPSATPRARSTSSCALLREHEIGLLADIRRYPGSKRYPHFAQRGDGAVAAGARHRVRPHAGARRTAQAAAGLAATWPGATSSSAPTPTTWPRTNFAHAIDKLLSLRGAAARAIMCAEAVPWRCHRNLVADELVRRGIEVIHIIGSGRGEGARDEPACARSKAIISSIRRSNRRCAYNRRLAMAIPDSGCPPSERDIVLAVDDNEQNLQLLEEYLSTWGYDVVHGARRPRGAAALSAASTRRSSCST